MKNDTAKTELLITGLSEGTTYEIAVKAGNHKGTSVLTPTIFFEQPLTSVTWATTKGAFFTFIFIFIYLLMC